MALFLPQEEANTQTLIASIVSAIQEIKGKDIVVLDLTHLQNAVAEYFVICSGDSTTQIEGIANSVVRETRKKLQEKPWNQEGMNNAEWVLLDYVNVVVHIFYRDVRDFYKLEDLWADAKQTTIENTDSTIA